jgi:hypothetical protein
MSNQNDFTISVSTTGTTFVGYKGNSTFQTGIIHAPYTPVTVTNIDEDGLRAFHGKRSRKDIQTDWDKRNKKQMIDEITK